ncbi:hypothetical protein A2V56_03940 [Candidatus Woesebacteria bacterium RBG_19FT_COMBO_42_9]|uniref:Uncharacterized protein n=1 Tax=Candidatus Woesebacteria bacterium RBG_16_42_24 TaxID=1802485 RepID=A0A1F7XJS6_9BACT|nr:MAG: hypothetical protein A2V97_01425 [Candidatus Woesebacteria bacterium RBG_16_42_24]OGM17775.1 MAG: hypothetical protein A2V56_03940 [Candidatus Woesebacteria bacterium RBG_19FT_COMBO_42_9]OGM67640.1 MAG: hypothetical protein A2985_00585 [Candidatus Woesebacteria bacterium RIFCSPLOWO2_01_FULL_43_11]
MPEEPGSGETRPGASLADILGMQQENAARKNRRDNPRHGTRIDERLNLEQADALDRARKRAHPTSGSTTSIPDRWSSTGQKPQRPGE